MDKTKKVYEVQEISKRPPHNYPDVLDKFILRKISFNLYKGEILTILGPSGAGKSTLLRLLNALDEPDEGQIRFHGHDLTHYNIFELRSKVGMVFQKPALLPGTVEENLDFPRKVKKKEEQIDLSNDQLLEVVGLSTSLLRRDSNALSVGQQQRVMIARALVNQPEVLLMDEPTSALDPSASKKILELTRELQQSYDLTVAFVTHNIPDARVISDRVMLLVQGQIKITESADNFFSGHSSKLADKFLAGELSNFETN